MAPCPQGARTDTEPFAASTNSETDPMLRGQVQILALICRCTLTGLLPDVRLHRPRIQGGRCWYPIPNFLGNIRPRNGKVLSAVIKVILNGYQNKFRKFGFAWGCVGMFLHLSPVQEYVYQRVAPFARGTYAQYVHSCPYH